MDINNITMHYRKSSNQGNLFSGYHVRYIITLNYESREISFDYQCNPGVSKVNLKDTLDCLVSDAYAYMNSSDPFEFIREFGYEDINEAERVYYGCKSNYVKLLYLLGSETEIKELNNVLQEE